MDDLISRQQAIDAINEIIRMEHSLRPKVYVAKDAIKALPSAQPEIIRCKDCNHFYKDNLNQWCFLGKYGVKENDFCSRAERRTDE